MSAGRTREARPISEGSERFVQSLPDYKPVSVPLRAVVIRLGQALLTGSSDLPESRTERAAPPLLFGLAPRGVCPASRIAPAAVRSYRTFSPLPRLGPPGGAALPRRYVFCGTFRATRFERVPPAVSRHAALRRPDFPPATQALTRAAGDCPSGRPHPHYRSFLGAA